MPTYEYRCAACGHEVEFFQSIREGPKRKCPRCGKQRLQRRISAGAGIVFKGSGFYQTDYRSESYKRGEQAAKETQGNSSGGASGAGKGNAPAGAPDTTKKPVKAKKDAPKSDAT
jgi:putative FmdB family regulatory protein